MTAFTGSTIKSEIRKAKTTKETYTKAKSSMLLLLLLNIDLSGNLRSYNEFRIGICKLRRVIS